MAVSWPADHVERRPIAALVPYANNSRSHSPAQIGQIAASIKQWGWTVPVLVDEAGGLIAGHARIAAARLLGIADAPVMVARGWSEDQKRAYVLADNQLAMNAAWDSGLLAQELKALAASAFDMDLIGFAPDELAQLLGGQDQGLTDPDDTPAAPAEPVTKRGDVWELGRHRIMCGDAGDQLEIEALTRGVVPDLANCDPPYGISVVKGGSIGKVGGGKPHPFAGRVHGRARNAIIEPGVYAPIIGDDTTDTAMLGYRTLVSIGVPAIVLWGGNYFANLLSPSRCWLVWDKENTGSFADCELAWTNQDAVVRLFRHQWSGLIKASERGEKRVHPTQKPVALANWVCKTVAPQATTVIDLFLGSGSALISAEQSKLALFGMELAPAYVDVAVLRWQAFTGLRATLEGGGRSFSDIANERVPITSAPVAAAVKIEAAHKSRGRPKAVVAI